MPATLELIGETRAGEPSRFALERGQTVEIMTGAPGPRNADAVVMVEHSSRTGNAVSLHQPIAAGRNLIVAGPEVSRGSRVLGSGATASTASTHGSFRHTLGAVQVPETAPIAPLCKALEHLDSEVQRLSGARLSVPNLDSTLSARQLSPRAASRCWVLYTESKAWGSLATRILRPVQDFGRCS